MCGYRWVINITFYQKYSLQTTPDSSRFCCFFFVLVTVQLRCPKYLFSHAYVGPVRQAGGKGQEQVPNQEQGQRKQQGAEEQQGHEQEGVDMKAVDPPMLLLPSPSPVLERSTGQGEEVVDVVAGNGAGSEWPSKVGCTEEVYSEAALHYLQGRLCVHI
jgi:hypothetical protein